MGEKYNPKIFHTILQQHHKKISSRPICSKRICSWLFLNKEKLEQKVFLLLFIRYVIGYLLRVSSFRNENKIVLLTLFLVYTRDNIVELCQFR